MGAASGEEVKRWEKVHEGMVGREDKILVLVRLRPLNEKEILRNEVADWECINNTSILYRNSLQERSGLPTACTFDGVFSGDCSTRQVYDKATKEIALSVVSGINSSIFAYGQTSSGKTYTMNGITEYTVADIYDYIQRHEERAFVLKFSALEIYNENVRDLLSADDTPLRLLDDPQRGTTVEKLTEETLVDQSHLKKLLSICEAQRKIGETSLNETSSRSHQILRLTIESSAREFIGKENSSTLSASVFFIDLAGSERASQSLSAGARLKEGCHINRSLLTLGNVIRKLSKGRQGHVNYRDSKLTRILQPCLGGNARTTIICTLSPARSHVEQSRNTLLFASCAKEVSTNAKVNVVMSDKALVKHLQKELARLESELRSPVPMSSSCNCAAVLKKKDLRIEKMENEIRELTKQRNLAQSRVEDLLQLIGNDEASCKVDGRGRRGNWNAMDKWEENPEVYPLVDDRDSSLSVRSEFVRPDQTQFEDEIISGTGEDDENCKEVRCIEIDETSSDRTLQSSTGQTVQMSLTANSATGHAVFQDLSSGNMHQNGFSFGALEQRMQGIQRTIESLASRSPNESGAWDLADDASSSRSVNMIRSRSSSEKFRIGSSSPYVRNDDVDSTPPTEIENGFPRRLIGFPRKVPPLVYGGNSARLTRNGSQSQSSFGTDFVDDLKSEDGKTVNDEDIPSVTAFVAELKDAKLEYEKQIANGKVWESGSEAHAALDLTLAEQEVSLDWHKKFEKLQRSIIELWATCNVSLVHRTYFFLLFKGDPTDSIYLEVELRRLTFLRDTLSGGKQEIEGGQAKTLKSSVKALRREREKLKKLINQRLTAEERKKLFHKWGIDFDSKKRRMQLVRRLWTDSKDLTHVEASAVVVAKLVNFSKDERAIKEMFGLSFAPPRSRKMSFGWRNSLPPIL
ncbi:hypothetical protein Drorol1_Dr00007493 [Drosera rotundifolia]